MFDVWSQWMDKNSCAEGTGKKEPSSKRGWGHGELWVTSGRQEDTVGMAVPSSTDAPVEQGLFKLPPDPDMR